MVARTFKVLALSNPKNYDIMMWPWWMTDDWWYLWKWFLEVMSWRIWRFGWGPLQIFQNPYVLVKWRRPKGPVEWLNSYHSTKEGFLGKIMTVHLVQISIEEVDFNQRIAGCKHCFISFWSRVKNQQGRQDFLSVCKNSRFSDINPHINVRNRLNRQLLSLCIHHRSGSPQICYHIYKS